jgi:putative ATP-dependent endonuclease of OLD family
VTLENFRAYQEPRRIEFGDLTTIIGRNDVGKSSILEALEIFFNGDEIEQTDANVRSGVTDVKVTAEFTDLPATITLDAGAMTTLVDEHLVASNGNLIIQKVYDCAKKTPSSDTYILANHPTAKGVGNLLELKEKDLQAIVKEQKLDAKLKGNPSMRRAIWGAAGDLQLADVAIPVSKPKEDSKRIWDQIELHLPMFALFQSDRASRDSDGEVQNPLKGAIQTAIAEVQEEIERIHAKVREKAVEIAELTHKTLKTIDPNLANALTPTFTPPSAAKWTGLFSLGMDTDDNIPLNKRGSGVRRLILVSFFKAEAERRLATASKANIIYAIEEPETSQHPANQRILMESFKEISNAPNCQVILTTHSPGLAADLPVDSIRFVYSDGPTDTPTIQQGTDVFGAVADTLGLTPDSRIKLLVCVEGPTDIEALKHLSHALHQADNTIPSLLTETRCASISLGGSTLKHWVTSHYLKGLRCPEVHIYDRDALRQSAERATYPSRQ